MGQYLADLEKAGVLTGDKTPATLEGLKEASPTPRTIWSPATPRSRASSLFRDRRIAALREVRLRARVRDRGADAGPGADPRGRLQVGRALPAARARARARSHPRFAPAYRALVDIALETREQAADPRGARSLRPGLRGARRRAAARQRERARLPGRARSPTRPATRRAPRRCSPTSIASRASTRRRSTSAASSQARQAALRVGAPNSLRDRRAGRPEPLHLLHRRPLLRHQGPGLPRARPHRARAGQVRRRLLLLFPRPRGFGAAARRAVRGVVVDVPEGRVRGGGRLPRGVRPRRSRQVAARARRDAAARDDRPQVVPRSTTCARRWTSWSRPTRPMRGEGRGAAQGSGRSGPRSTAACSASDRSRRRAIRSSSC